ncbi:MAG: hypothetical protein H0V83_04775 [Rubrobacter sp.]|nr:hypothetical protein [Rubrobacter sp.]
MPDGFYYWLAWSLFRLMLLTLAPASIAALLNLLRRRIQSFINRLFYHKKFDADDLVSVVHDTMRPNHVSLWLRLPKDRA